VSVHRATRSPVDEVLHAFGHIRPAQILHLPMPAAQAAVTEVQVRQGDLVRAGQVLARLDSEEATRTLALARSEMRAALADVRIAQSQLTQAEADMGQRVAAHDMLVQLAQTGSSSAAQRHDAERAMERAALDVEAAHARLEMAMAQVDRMRLTIEAAAALVDDMVITAPVAGRVMRVDMETGATPGIGAPLVSIAVGDRMQAVLQVTPAAVTRVQAGDAARLWLPGDVMAEGRVTQTGPGGEGATDLSEVIVDLPHDPRGDAGLGAGTTLRAEIITDSRTAIVIPASALVPLPEGPGVFRVIDNRAVARPVSLVLQADGTHVEITAGLPEGAPYVALAGSVLRNGDAVLPVSPATGVMEGEAPPRNLWQEASASARPGQVRP
jgi:RND family efflux transporter MFP subunit